MEKSEDEFRARSVVFEIKPSAPSIGSIGRNITCKRIFDIKKVIILVNSPDSFKRLT